MQKPLKSKTSAIERGIWQISADVPRLPPYDCLLMTADASHKNSMAPPWQKGCIRPGRACLRRLQHTSQAAFFRRIQQSFKSTHQSACAKLSAAAAQWTGLFGLRAG